MCLIPGPSSVLKSVMTDELIAQAFMTEVKEKVEVSIHLISLEGMVCLTAENRDPVLGRDILVWESEGAAP